MKKYQVNDFIDKYKIIRVIGKGGFGTVYEAVRTEGKHTYRAAIKVIHISKDQENMEDVIFDGLTEDNLSEYYNGIIDELIEECALMEDMKGDSHIVSYEDHHVESDEDNSEWMVIIRMELLAAFSRGYKKIGVPMLEKDVIKLGMDMCRALETCEKKNKVIHRDIKPENIFVSKTGNYKLGDFGIAKVLGDRDKTASKKGTEPYMAPEVSKGLMYDSTVDIYSLGLVLYRLMNRNRAPFLPPAPEKFTYSQNKEAQYRRIACDEDFNKPQDASPEFAKVILKACSYRPENRYQHAQDMRKDLEKIMGVEIESDYSERIWNALFEDENDMVEVTDNVSEGNNDDSKDSGDEATRNRVGGDNKPQKVNNDLPVDSIEGGGTVSIAKGLGNVSIKELEEEEKRRVEEEKRKKAEEEARRRAEEEERKRAEEEARRQAEEEERKRVEEEARRRAEEEKRKKAEEEARRRAEEEEQKRAEEEACRRAEEEERKRAEEEARRRAEEEECKRAEEEARRRAEEEERKKAEEEARIQAEKEARSKIAEEGDSTPEAIKLKKDHNTLHDDSLEELDHVVVPSKNKDTTSRDKKKIVIPIIAACVICAIVAVYVLSNQKIKMPDLIGMTEDEVKSMLSDKDILITVQDGYFTGMDKDVVVSQGIPAGERVEKQSECIITVNRGIPETMPAVDNTRTIENVKSEFEAMGFVVNSVEVYSTIEAGYIVAQDPAADTPIEPGMTITFYVSKGATQMPEIVGKSQDDAKAELDALNVHYNINEVESSDYDTGIVVSQDIDIGSAVGYETTVNINVCSGPKQLSVPSLAGMSEEDAKNTLMNAGFSDDKIEVTYEYSNSVEKGMVVSQSVEAESKVDEGSTVSIAVSAGAKPVNRKTGGNSGGNSDDWHWDTY